MAQHTYSRCVIHLVWSTRKRKPVLEREVRKRLSGYLYSYSEQKKIYMLINYVNTDHVHALVDLPVSYSIREVAKLFKGSSSHWINKNRLTSHKFRWARGYGAFSVSHTAVDNVKSYIRNQEEHHRRMTFSKEFSEFLDACGLEV